MGAMLRYSVAPPTATTISVSTNTWPRALHRIDPVRQSSQAKTVPPMNVDQSGHVFVGAVEGRDIESLLVRLADASRAVHEALLVLDD